MSTQDNSKRPIADCRDAPSAVAEDVMRGSKVQSRPAGAWETSRKKRFYRRLTLRRADGRVYLNRWGFGHDRIGGVLLHRMDAPDPGVDLHDHPWWFVSIILWGGYTEERANIRDAARLAADADELDKLAGRRTVGNRGLVEKRRWLSVRTMRLDECHTITDLTREVSWSLVIKGPRRRRWGFYLADGYMPEAQYDATVRAERRDLWSDQNLAWRPWSDPSITAQDRERDTSRPIGRSEDGQPNQAGGQ